jgi:ATP-dependent RNA helicase DDX27
VASFRSGKTTHLLATDLASRGLDIKNVLTVINYEAPQSHEIYLHRVGRTARAGKSGRACTIAAEPDRKVVKAAVKSARAQGAKIVSRMLESVEVDELDSRLQGMQDEIEAVLLEEQEEKQLAQADMQLTRGENLVKHEKEIMARPKRTWFESEKEKRASKKAGRAELNGPESVLGKKPKQKLSGKDKKRLDDRRERTEGKMWKKGKGSEELAKAKRRSSKTGRSSKGASSTKHAKNRRLQKR